MARRRRPSHHDTVEWFLVVRIIRQQFYVPPTFCNWLVVCFVSSCVATSSSFCNRTLFGQGPRNSNICGTLHVRAVWHCKDEWLWMGKYRCNSVDSSASKKQAKIFGFSAPPASLWWCSSFTVGLNCWNFIHKILKTFERPGKFSLISFHVTAWEIQLN